jgi:hypothetical protein
MLIRRDYKLYLGVSAIRVLYLTFYSYMMFRALEYLSLWAWLVEISQV